MKLELELRDERVAALTKQLEELSVSSQGDQEITQLKKIKHELQNKNKEQVSSFSMPLNFTNKLYFIIRCYYYFSLL